MTDKNPKGESALGAGMNFYEINYRTGWTTYIQAENSAEAVKRFEAGDWFAAGGEPQYEIESIDQVETQPVKEPGDQVQILTDEEWKARFRPIHNSILDTDHLPDDINAAYVWTQVTAEDENKTVIANGILRWDREGYWLCVVPVKEGEHYEAVHDWGEPNGGDIPTEDQEDN